MNDWLQGGDGGGGAVALKQSLMVFHLIGTELFKVCRPGQVIPSFICSFIALLLLKHLPTFFTGYKFATCL